MNVNFYDRTTAKKLFNTDINGEALISISDTIEELNEMSDITNVTPALFLSFYDVDDSEHGMNEDHAKAIVNFVTECNRRKLNINVHCFAGVSRSGAIAKWINDHYGLDNVKLNSYSLYNKHIYSMLMNISSGCIDLSNSMFNQ